MQLSLLLVFPRLSPSHQYHFLTPFSPPLFFSWLFLSTHTHFSPFHPSHCSYSFIYPFLSFSASSFLTLPPFFLPSFLTCLVLPPQSGSVALADVFFFFLFSFAISSDLIQLFLYLCSRFSLTLHSISLAFSFLSATHSPLFHSLSLSLAQPTISVLGLCLSSQSPSLFRLCSKALLNEMIQMAFYGAVQHNQAEHGRQS